MSDAEPPIVDCAADGTPLFAPRGALPVEDGEGRVQCHLCGRWFRSLGSSHLVHAHGTTAAEYRVLAGLRPRHPLEAPALSAARAAVMRRLIATDPRVLAGMAIGARLAETGDLQRRADEVRHGVPVALERERQLVAGGARLGSARAAAYRRRREQRARTLGYADLEAFYLALYIHDRVRLERLADDLRCAESAVRGDLQRLGLGPDRTRSYGARWRKRA